MEIINPSSECITEPDLLKLIEIAGRTCYKSDAKITDGSSVKFTKMLVNRGHYSVFGHAHVCFEIDDMACKYLRRARMCTKYLRITEYDRILVSGSLWAWIEFFDANESPVVFPTDLYKIEQYLAVNYSQLFKIRFNWFYIMADKIKESDMSDYEKLHHATRTYRFITNRAIQQELTRHRPWDYSIESTRYIAYSGDIKFIKPVWLDDSSTMQKVAWKALMKVSELGYKLLRKLKWRAEQARGVLPLDLSGEIVATATIAEWHHMLKKRTAKDAHPQIRDLMYPLLKQFNIRRSCDG